MSACRYIVQYLSYIYLLNPIYYIKEKEKTLYYNDADGDIPLKPKWRERIANLLLSGKVPN